MRLPDPRIEPTIGTADAAALLGCSADCLYDLAKRDEAPVAPLRLGRRLRWPTAQILRVLGFDEAS